MNKVIFWDFDGTLVKQTPKWSDALNYALEKELIILNNYYKDYIINQCDYVLYDNAIETLEKCIEKGYKNYILSNDFPELASVIERIGISKYFEDYVVSANLGYEKPRTEIFKYALKLADNPKTCYMVGDNPIADIQGANDVGITSILVNRKCENVANFVCEDLIDIIDVII